MKKGIHKGWFIMLKPGPHFVYVAKAGVHRRPTSYIAHRCIEVAHPICPRLVKRESLLDLILQVRISWALRPKAAGSETDAFRFANLSEEVQIETAFLCSKVIGIYEDF